jgi:hypothetical protein
MDVERVIEFILNQQAKNEVQAAKNEALFAETKADTNKIFGMIAQMGAIQLRAEDMLESLSVAQTRTDQAIRELTASQALTDQAIQALAAKQAITEEKLQGLIDAMRRNQNGHA